MGGKGKSIAAFLSLVFIAMMAGVFLESGDARASRVELQGAKTDVGASSIGCSSDAECDDGEACNGLETCSAGVCQPGTPLDCDDGDACTEDSCDPVSGCVNVSTKPTADAGDDVTICDGESTTLDATGSTGTGLTYAWSPGCSASATHTVSPTTDTTYTVVVTATGGPSPIMQKRGLTRRCARANRLCLGPVIHLCLALTEITHTAGPRPTTWTIPR